MASAVLQSISKDENERMRLMSIFKGEMDLQSKLGCAEREKAKEIARKMKERGRPLEEIAEDTGLSIAQIKDL